MAGLARPRGFPPGNATGPERGARLPEGAEDRANLDPPHAAFVRHLLTGAAGDVAGLCGPPIGHLGRPRESGDPCSPPVLMGPGSRCARPGRRSLDPGVEARLSWTPPPLLSVACGRDPAPCRGRLRSSGGPRG